MSNPEKTNIIGKIDYERLGAKHRGDNPFADNGFFSACPSITLDEFGKCLDEMKARGDLLRKEKAAKKNF